MYLNWRVTKNVQSIRDEGRLPDCLVELDIGTHDIVLLTEIWRSKCEEVFSTPGRGKIYMSGGLADRGVGIYVSRQFSAFMEKPRFHAFAPCLCMLQFSRQGRLFHVYACYFPTSWDSDVDLEQVDDVLDVLLLHTQAATAFPLIGGDFNANVGALPSHDISQLLGGWGSGTRSDGGRRLVHWVLTHGCQIISRHAAHAADADSWTCQRASDWARFQLDCILADIREKSMQIWHNFSIGTGLDHRSVHCTCRVCVRSPRKFQHRTHNFRSWKPKK